MMRAALACLLLLTLPGCWLTWVGYEPPRAASDYVTADISAPCPRVGVQNLTRPRERAAVVTALRDVCDIMASEAFAARVLGKSDWLATCQRPNGKEDAIPAAEVLRIVRLPKSDFSVLARKPLLAVAEIDPPAARIAIRRRWFEYWESGTADQRAQLIRSLGHELTHFVREDGTALFRFQDGGHGSARCPDERLASYAIGEMVADLWLEGTR